MPTKFTRPDHEPLRLNPALLRYAELTGRIRLTPWQRFERAVQTYPEAWVVGLILAAGLVAHYLGN